MRLAGNDITFWHSNNSLITPHYTSFTVSSTEKYDRNRQHRERAGRASSYHYTTCKQAGNTAITGTGEYDRSRQHPEQYGRYKSYYYISSFSYSSDSATIKPTFASSQFGFICTWNDHDDTG
jgi:hypothetical protein